jgi:hypothetical protein
MKILFAALTLFLLSGSVAIAQCDGKPGPDGLTWNFDEGEREKFNILRFVGGIFTPEIIKETKQIRAYIRDPRFVLLVKRCSDVQAMDFIYLKALKISDHNLSRALFLSMIACLEHQNVDLKMPLVGSLGVPLTFEEDSIFKARFANLPSRLYADSPREGDKDKLQHFFGSAYIAYASESRELARTSGNLIEWGEAQFVVGGVDDPRDRRSNKQGERFGHDLLTVKNLLPSDYLNLTIEE